MGRVYVVEDDLKLESGRLCLDFCNTIDWHASQNPIEGLNSYDDLVRWAGLVGLLDEGEAADLRRAAEARPAQAEAVRQEAIALREALYRIFSTLAHGACCEPVDVDRLNAGLKKSQAHIHLTQEGDDFVWAWDPPEGALESILWPVARSAADLLTGDELDRVKECADDRGCGWLFLDMSRNRSRQWCDMKSCGNRAKARRHYEKVRVGLTGAEN